MRSGARNGPASRIVTGQTEERSTIHKRTVGVLLILLVLTLGSCGDGERANSTTTTIPATTTAPVSTSTTTTDSVPPPTLPQSTTTTTPASDVLTYFEVVALGAEFGASNPVVRKWKQDLKIVVRGNPTTQDMTTLMDVLNDLDALIDTIEFEIVDDGGNVDIYFVPESDFGDIVPQYQPINLGFFWVYWSDTEITDSTILITTVGVTQAERSHLIREELTQSLGLMNDSYLYEDSIFFQGWTDTDRYSALDEAVIALLYRSDIEYGMTADQVRAVLGAG